MGNTKEQELTFGFVISAETKDRCIMVYEEHNKKVTNYFASRENKLLTVCWETGSGFEELCLFLNKDIPRVKFPHSNKKR